MDTMNSERIDRTKSFKINRGIVQYLKLLPLYGEYENTLIWALLAEEYMHFESKSHRQVRVFTQYNKYKRAVDDIANAVKSSGDETATASLFCALEEIFFVRLVVYEGDYTTAGIRGKSRIPGKLRTVYDSRVEEDQQRPVYIYRMYNGEWLPGDTSLTNKSTDCMYVLILDHDVFISRFNTEATNEVRSSDSVVKEQQRLSSDSVAKSGDSIAEEPRSWWQTEILDLYDTEPDDKKIYWYWSEDGKDITTFAKQLCKRYDDVIICTVSADKYGKCTVSVPRHKRGPRMIVYDMRGCRDSERIPYRIIEAIKEGVFCTAEHNCETWLHNPPHVVVFANVMPEYEKMTGYQWIISG